jgi:hypothetical protein
MNAQCNLWSLGQPRGDAVLPVTNKTKLNNLNLCIDIGRTMINLFYEQANLLFLITDLENENNNSSQTKQDLYHGNRTHIN